jgi:hypothetical protein
MFSENRKRPIWTEFRGCFPHAEEKQVHTKKSNKIEYLKTVDSQRALCYFIVNRCELQV